MWIYAVVFLGKESHEQALEFRIDVVYGYEDEFLWMDNGVANLINAVLSMTYGWVK